MPDDNKIYTNSTQPIYFRLFAFDFEDDGSYNNSGAGWLELDFEIGDRVGHKCSLGWYNNKLGEFELIGDGLRIRIKYGEWEN